MTESVQKHSWRARSAGKCIRVLTAALVLTALGTIWAGWIGATPAKGQAPELFIYGETTLVGVVSAQVAIPLQGCQRLCATRSGCAGYDYAVEGGTCRLFAAISQANDSRDHTSGTRNTIAGYRPPDGPNDPVAEPSPPPQQEAASPPPRVAFTRYVNRDLSGAASETHRASNTSQCEEMCRSISEWCTAFTFDKWNRKCFLKRRPGDLMMNARATSGVVSSSPTPPSSGSQIYFEYFNNKAFPGNGYRSVTARSRGGCENECWSQRGCMAFSFTSSRNLCVLYDQPGEYSSRRGTSSGAKRQE